MYLEGGDLNGEEKGRSQVLATTARLEIDFETRSDVDLKTRGVYNYMSSPHTVPLMASYLLGDGPVKRWLPDAPCPPDIVAHVTAGGVIVAHNAQFERLLWQTVLTPRYGWPSVATEQFRCTAAMAAAMSLPRSLDGLGQALNLTIQKDKEGSRLIRKFSLPRRPKKNEAPGLYFNSPEEHAEDFELFRRYCDVDVLAEAEAEKRMIPLSDDEQDMWVIDQRINDRGIRIDRKSAIAALNLAEIVKSDLNREMRLATGGYVPSTTQPGKLVEWVQGMGVAMNSAAKAEIEEILECDDLPANVRKAIEIRQEAAKTSVSKLSAFLERASDDDGRIRGAFLYCAAGTGRWSSVGAQLHNLPRPRKVFTDAKLKRKTLFHAIRTQSPQLLRTMYGDTLGRPMWLLSDAIRGFIWAAPNHDLLVADYSNIEGAVAAWFAGEDWKVKAMSDILADPSLPDLYRRAAAGIFNTTAAEIGKKDERRQVGKVSELSLQYQGGPGAFRSMARNYGMKLAPVFPIVWEAASDERREKAEKRYESACKRKEPVTELMTREEFLAAEIIKLGWRATHPAISSSWIELEDAARQAVESPGTAVRALKADYLMAKGFLWCRLPSGRCLAYGAPRVKEQVWVKKRQEDGTFSEAAETMAHDEAIALEREGKVSIEGEAKSAVTALGVNSVTKKWERFALWGGLILENLTQGIARDLLANGIKKAEVAGYPVIGHVHDEILTEVPRGFGDVEDFEKIICELPQWATGLPLAASGWRGKRYRKD